MREATEISRPVPLDIDIYTDENLADPFAAHAEIRNAAPVVHMTRYDVYAMGRHRDIRAALKDWQTFSSSSGIGLADIRKPGAWRAPSPIGEVDPPDHTKVRTVMQRVLSPAALRDLRSAFESEADRLVKEAVQQGEFDGVGLAEAFVARVFPNSLGLKESPERTRNLFTLGAWNFNGQGPKNELFLESDREVAEISDWYETSQARENLVPGGFGEKVYQAADAGEINHATAKLLVRAFVRGGLDTTASAISAALYYLARDPKQWEILRANPALARSALEEAVRLETPIQIQYRVTTRPVEVSGVHIEADRKVALLLASANRDPDFWQNPDEFDINRQRLEHVAFGNGIHMCVGQMLARLEGEVLLRAVVGYVSELTLAGEPRQRINNNLRSLATLPLKCTA